jgi:uncharacterized membrane protein HdeD (DUF308 family)
MRKEHTMDSKAHTISRIRWAIGINGALSVAFGVMVLAWPSISLYALTILFGAYALANGVVQLVQATRVKEGRGWMVFSGLLGVGVGIAVLVWPSISALSLLYVIGAYALTTGIVLIGGSFWLPLHGGDSFALTMTGLVAILFGIVMFAKPGDGALVLLGLIAAFSLVTGIAQLVLALGGRRIVERDLRHLGGAAA